MIIFILWAYVFIIICSIWTYFIGRKKYSIYLAIVCFLLQLFCYTQVDYIFYDKSNFTITYWGDDDSIEFINPTTQLVDLREDFQTLKEDKTIKESKGFYIGKSKNVFHQILHTWISLDKK